MGIREQLNQNPGITTGVTAGVIVVALIFILWQSFGGSGRPQIQETAYFTTDDSSEQAALAALFVDKIDKVPPFDHNGKQAYRAYVFTCDGGKTKFISHLERYTPDAKRKIEEARNATPSDTGAPMIMEEVYMTGMEVKDPGPGPWVRQNNYDAYAKITDVRCPDGKIENIEPVLP